MRPYMYKAYQSSFNIENTSFFENHPKTEITSFTGAVNIVLCQFLRVDKLNEHRNRSFRA